MRGGQICTGCKREKEKGWIFGRMWRFWKRNGYKEVVGRFEGTNGQQNDRQNKEDRRRAGKLREETKNLKRIGLTFDKTSFNKAVMG